MAINGLHKFSLIDYPGKVCCVVFAGGCNFRCPFCHNPALVFDPESQGRISLEELGSFLATRTGKLDAVVFSGGEPTLWPELPAALRLAAGMGFLTRIDTNGSRPEVIEALHGEGLPDSLGVDYKAPQNKYAAGCGITEPGAGARVRRLIAFALARGIDLEVRTTVHRELLSAGDLGRMDAELRELGVQHWVWQQFHPAEVIDEGLGASYSDTELQRLAERVGPHVKVRGVR